MKRKKWSEAEEQTLLSKYNDLRTSGSLSKLKTREKKFRPIADQVNAVHHLQDPVAFPFKWSWRDVSIKVQNMRHQYIGVKQKIRVSKDEFSWKDGEHHWENFLRYKEVFGDVELLKSSKKFFSMSTDSSSDLFRDCGDLGLGFDSEDDDQEDGEEDDEELKGGESNCDDEDDDDDDEDDDSRVSGDDCNNGGGIGEDQDCEFGGKDKKGKLKGVNKRLGLLGAQIVELRDTVVRREEKRREREFDLETRAFERKKRTRSEELDLGMEMEERKMKDEKDLEEKRRKKMREMEEKREEEEMEWREKLLRLQIEHEKLMMQMQAEACQNQIQILGVMARLVCSIYGSGGSDGLGGGLGGLQHHQVMQNLQQHPGGLDGGDDNGKPDHSSSPSEFL
ncbi:hypothetical protein LINGRAHAP2_LOCUS19114 [Linum grandiflorum]